MTKKLIQINIWILKLLKLKIVKDIKFLSVGLYQMQRKGLNPWRYPECFIKCCAKLPEAEVDKFEAWVVNPAGEPSPAYAEADEKWDDGSPPLPIVQVINSP